MTRYWIAQHKTWNTVTKEWSVCSKKYNKAEWHSIRELTELEVFRLQLIEPACGWVSMNKGGHYSWLYQNDLDYLSSVD